MTPKPVDRRMNRVEHAGFVRYHRRLMVRICCGALVVLLLPLTLSAQAPLFSSGIDLVHVGVTVVDRDGRLITDLEADDFDLLEDGHRQEVRYFSRSLASDADTIPLHLGVLFDASSSMERDGRFVKTAVIKFLNTITYAADMTLVDFDSEVRVGRYGQRDFPRLVERIRNREATGYTALYDALGVYLDGAFAQDGRKVLLLYTDGEDTRSLMPFDETHDLVRASDVTIYAIGLQKNLRASVRRFQRMRLDQLTSVTGGRSYYPESVDALNAIYDEIASELAARYSLGFVSTNDRSDGTWREVEVRLTGSRPDLRRAKVRTRDGYYALYREAEARDR